MEDKKIFRIVLTGGPCSGKTTAAVHISERLRSLGFNVYIVPEAATMMILGGISLLEGDIISNQLRLLQLQKQLEATFLQTAYESNKPAIVLYDRGAMDNKAFIPDKMWNDFLATMEDSTVDLRDLRYDAVIHLVSAAVGAPEFYTLANNAARSESLEQAALLDQKLQDAWIGHPHLRVIGNYPNFEDKIRKILCAICNVVGLPEPIERERKFLVSNSNLANLKLRQEVIDIEQTYLLSNKNESARVRKRGQHGSFTYTYTVKQQMAPGKNFEREKMISVKEFIRSLEQADPTRRTIKKERTCFLWENQYFELDHFLAPCHGLYLLEAELETDGDQINLPPFLTIDKEVTDDPNYSNANLAKKPEFQL